MRSQVVFLIDTDIEHCYSSNITKLSNSVCLGCLRILHHLSSQNDKGGLVRKSKLQHTLVKWSYKFFSSKAFATKIETHKFYDFRLKYFEEFENEVQRRFELSETEKNKLSTCCPSDSIHLALMQLLADFQWENTDILSPVKGKRSRKSNKTSNNQNLVVLFSKCPKTTSELKLFCGKQVPDSDVFLDALLPGSLHQQFCNINHLKLYILDTHHSKFWVGFLFVCLIHHFNIVL